MRVVESVLRTIDGVGKWSGYIIAPLSLLMMLAIMFEVIARYVFNAPTIWAHEITTFLFGAQFMLGGAFVFWQGSFINVDLIHQRLPLRARAVVDMIMFGLPLLICLLMIWKGGASFWQSYLIREHTQSYFSPPIYPLRATIPIAALLLLLQVSAKFTRDSYVAFTGRQL